MSGDLNADARAAHGVSREVLDAELAKVLAEGADLERDAEAKLAELSPSVPAYALQQEAVKKAQVRLALASKR